MEPHSLKLTIKLKSEKSVNNYLTTADHLSNVGEKPSASNSNCPGSLAAYSRDPVEFSSPGGLDNHNKNKQDEENASDISEYQLVLYNPSANGPGEAETPDAISDQPLSSQRQNQRSLSVGAFTVQCANCFKWRLIPTKEKYEEIREHIMEQPFICEAGREWRPDISCDDPPDLVQDGSRVWAIDKPSIARPPPRWQRLLKFRGEGSTKFADVYYVAPSGKRLRSMVEVQRHLEEHPEFKEQGVRLSQFSFQIPRPLQENYVRKRPAPARTAPTNDADDIGMLRLPHPSDAQPLSWVSPDVDTDLQLSRRGPAPNYPEPETQSAKKKKTPSKKVNDDLVHSPIAFKMKETNQL